MIPLALLKTPLVAVERGPFGVRMGESEGHVNGWPLVITLTHAELHIAFSDRDGPRFAIDLNLLIKTAVDQIEVALGVKGKK